MDAGTQDAGRVLVACDQDADLRSEAAGKEGAGVTEPVSKVRLCGMSHPRADDLIRFRAWSTEDLVVTVTTTADNLMRRYGPEQGYWRWEIEPERGAFW